MKLEPIYTIADLKACKPSDLLEKAVEAYPDIEYNWNDYSQIDFNRGSCCPAALLFGAAGDVDGLWRGQIKSPPALTFDPNIPGLGYNLSRFSQRMHSFREVIDSLREIGC